MAAKEESSSPRKRGRPGPAVLEWTMGALGLLLTLALVILVGQEALSTPAPADLELRLVQARPVSGGWVAEVEVENTGDLTAAAVQIEGRLGAETAVADLDYAPAGGKETVVLPFRTDPRQGLQLRPLGWTEP